MSADIYRQAMKYENLVKLAFNCPTGSKNGANLNLMQNAMTMENGESYAKHLGSFEKQFKVVQNYLAKALIKFSKTKPFATDCSFFQELESATNNSYSTVQLNKIVDIALERVLILRK